MPAAEKWGEIASFEEFAQYLYLVLIEMPWVPWYKWCHVYKHFLGGGTQVIFANQYPKKIDLSCKNFLSNEEL